MSDQRNNGPAKSEREHSLPPSPGSQFRSWRWWLVVLFVVPPGVLIMLPTAIPASVLPWMADKAERLDYWWQTKLHGILGWIFVWEKRKRDAENVERSREG